MKRVAFTHSGGPMPDCYALVPETDAEKQELIAALEDRGVQNSMAFNKSGINGRLDIAADPEWDSSGAVKISVTVAGKAEPKDAWFWVVACDDGPDRKFAYWSLERDIRTAGNWS